MTGTPDRLLEMVSYIVRRIAASDETDGLDAEIVDHLLTAGFEKEEIGAAFRFLAAVALDLSVHRPGEEKTKPEEEAAGAPDGPRPIVERERLRLAEEAEALWNEWIAARVLAAAEAEEILRRTAEAPAGGVDAATLRRHALAVAPAGSPFSLYLAETTGRH